MSEPAAIMKPAGPGPHPGVVLGAEAYGPNEFIEGVQERLAGLGFASVVPDYYHGAGPTKRDAYDDYEEVVEHIAALDFTRGGRDLTRAIDALRAEPDLDARRIAVWGYCTGATLAWLAACMRGDLAAAVLFFPSQPMFEELTPTHPVHPVDLLWQLTCPTLIIVRRPGCRHARRVTHGSPSTHRSMAGSCRGARVPGRGPRVLRAMGATPPRGVRPTGMGRRRGNSSAAHCDLP